jgi:hypothetical protein
MPEITDKPGMKEHFPRGLKNAPNTPPEASICTGLSQSSAPIEAPPP